MKNQSLRIDREQAEKLAELGYRLQQFRQRQGLPLEEIAARTLIPVRTLAAIEEGNRKHLPEPVYIQGFIRRYADAIGMNGAEFASAFPTHPIVTPPRSPWKGFSFQANLRPQHLYLLYIALVIGAVSGLSYLLNRSSAQTAVQPNLALPTLQSSISGQPIFQAGAGGIVQPGSDSQSAPAVEKKAVRVGLTLTDQSWLRVIADGKTEFEGVLPEGTKRTWVANKQVVVRAGNAGGVLVSVNNTQAKPLGAPGSVEEVTFGTGSQASNGAEVPVAILNLTAVHPSGSHL